MIEYKNSKTDDKQIKLNEKYILELISTIDFINKIYEENKTAFNNKYILTKKDKKIMKFIFENLSKILKYRDIKTLLNINKKKFVSKKKNSQNISEKINSAKDINIFISNFINICVIKSRILQKYLRNKDLDISNRFFRLTKFLFIKDYIDEKGLKLILGFQLILSLYKDDEKSGKIEDIKKIFLVINFLLSFSNNDKYFRINENKIKQITTLISFLIKILKEYILINFANVCLLSRSKSFFKLIEFCKITSFDERAEIMNLLVDVYKYKLNIDFILDDLSEQFLYNIEKDSLNNKTKLLIEKNNFLNNIFKKETQLIKGEIIKNGFYFSNFPNNGIKCEPVNTFPKAKKGYSIVLSFRLMFDNDNKTKNKKYTIFSLTNKDNNIMNVYIEDHKVKIGMKNDKKPYELDNEITTNISYILWIIQFKDKKPNMIVYLNEKKTTFNKIAYPDGNYRINLGCNINKNNKYEFFNNE